MIEQWFLDLDGIRSGPYQTPEVMSLVAEGEVLPHHRISTGLSSQNWITILDWRLEQAKVSQKPKTVAEYSERSEISPIDFEEAIKTRDDLKTLPESEISHFTEQRAELEIEVESKAPAPTPQKPVPPKPVAAVAAPSARPAPAAVLEDLEKPEPTLSDLKRELEKGVPKEPPRSAKGSGNTAFIKRPGAIAAKEPAPPAPHPPVEETEERTAPHDVSRTRRDPMAEMFDVLQKTKQKREAKQNSSAASGISIEQDHGAPIKGFNLGRTLMIGGGITLIGFALGQVFQQQAAPVHETNLPSAPPKSVSTPAPKSNAQVIDRSTDKMTIRSTVEHKPEPTPAKPQAKAAAAPVANNPHPESPQTEKELEELRNLKKELQELKNLKTNAAEEQPVVAPEEGDGFDAVDQRENTGAMGSGSDAQGGPGTNPNEAGQPTR